MMKASPFVRSILRCPACKDKLLEERESLICRNPECRAVFPVAHDVPVLINEKRSVFSLEDYKDILENPNPNSGMARIKKLLSSLVPAIGKNLKGEENYREFAELLLSGKTTAKVLVIGGGTLGVGMEVLAADRAIEMVETDVFLTSRTMLICDAHDIPFEDGSFDGVIVQAVLEHVIDPFRCVDEIHRVLNKTGMVYAETPFMQQVHMGKYDFMRFTYLGHRRLFRKFEEIKSGVIGGPGMALAWSYMYFLLSFAKSNIMRKLLIAFASLTSFYLKFFDYYLAKKPGGYDSASGFYFMGVKSDEVLDDRELLKGYKGSF